MSALDRLENYSARKNTTVSSSKFDITTPEGAFLQLVHNKGYKMYDEDGNFTELYTALTTGGNQRIQAIAGSGKALVNGTKIMTERGLRPIEKLRVGETVFGEDGKSHKILGVFPQGKKQPYEIRFNNGSVIECCKDHIWTVVENGVMHDYTTLDLLHKGGIFSLPKVKPLCYNSEYMTSDSEMQSYINYIVPEDSVVPNRVLYGNVGMRRNFVKRYLELGGSKVSLIKLLSSLGKYVRVSSRGSLVIEAELKIVEVKKSNKDPVDMTCIMVDNPSHLYLIEGGIPTHNTTMLIFKIMHDIVTGETMRNQLLPNGNYVSVVDKVFVGTFLRSGAEELKTKLSQWQRALGYRVTATSVNFGTLHAEFKHCLNEMGVATPIGSQTILNGLLRKAINMCNITRNGDPLNSEDYKIIESILTYYRGRLDDKRYRHPSAGDYSLTPSILDLLARQFRQLKQAEGVMDFEDLQELLYKYIYVTPNQNVIDFVADRYKYMYLDEFQDTSQIQYALLKAYGRGWLKDSILPTKGKIVVVGDVEQCIYSFRGSDIDVMQKHFNEDFDPTNNSLSYNYRCPSNILNPVIDSIGLNPEAEGVEIKPFNQGGIFNAYSFSSVVQMLSKLQGDLDEDIDNQMSIGILCRTNYDGMIPALYLEMLGRYQFSISGEAMSLNSALPKRILRVGRLFTEKCTPAVKDVLTMLVPSRDKWGVNKLFDVMKQNRLSIWEIPDEDLEYECVRLYYIISHIKSMRSKSDDIEVLKFVYNWLKNNVFSGDSSYCEGARSCIDVVLFFLYNKDFKSISEFLDEMDELNERLLGRVGKNKGISIATVHEFKGKERDSIYIWNDSDGVFPGAKVDLKDSSQVEEERRVHYIACTRARKKSTIYTKAGGTGMFLAEMDCKIQPKFISGTSKV